MSKPLYRDSSDGRISGLRGDVGRLQRKPLTSEWVNPALYHSNPLDRTAFIDLLALAPGGWTQSATKPPHEFRRHADGTLEVRGYLTPGTSDVEAYTLPGLLDDEVDYRPDIDSDILISIDSGAGFAVARYRADWPTGIVIITFPAT